LEHAREGRLVYHGYVGHLLLGSGFSHLISIRLIADMQFRIKAAMERMNLDRDSAVAYIEKVDRQRHRWAKFLYGVGWEDAHLYDAVFNLEHNSIEGICDLIVHMTKLDTFQVTDQSRRSFDDFALSSRVWANLAKDKQTRSAYINVLAQNGNVTITGSVGSEKTVKAITRAVAKVQGVKAVQNQVTVGSDWYG
jgi:hypothetical protein